YREHGITGLPGGLAEYLSIAAVNVVKVTTSIDSSEAALVEPLGCILHSSNVVAKTPSRHTINGAPKDQRVRTILICGAGPAGLLFVQYLRGVARYDGSLIVADPNVIKRQLAKQFGASETIDPATSEVPEIVREYTGGKGVEYLIEASGAGEVVALIPQLIRKQATVLFYGHGHAGTDMSVLNNLLFKEPKLVATVGASGCFDEDGRPSVYRRSLKLLEEKKIKVGSMITHRYSSLRDVETAL